MKASNGRWLTAALAAGLMIVPVSSTGCFGKFNVMRNMYEFNKRVSPNKWARWGVFLAFNVVPVYGVAAFMDAFIFNSIEFWTGKNPAKDVVRSLPGPDGATAHLRVRPDGRLDVVMVRADGSRRAFSFVREPEALALTDAQGRLLARVADVDGAPRMVAGALHSVADEAL